jgi:WD repeat-containing protein 76
MQFCDSTRLVSCSYDGVVRLLDMEKGAFEVVHTSTDSSVTFHSVHVDPTSNGKVVLCGDSYGTLLWCDLRCATATALRVTQAHQAKIFTIDTHPLSAHVCCTASLDRCVKLWDSRKAHANFPLRELSHGLCVSSAHFSPTTGTHLATVCNDDLVRVYPSQPLLLEGGADPTPTRVHHNKLGLFAYFLFLFFF